uniref:HESX homeobox 1 n=1 Tax=Latimeria chalumnae TaxID=7897 RepID=H3AS77_LATCH
PAPAFQKSPIPVEKKPPRCSFSIDSILGLDKKEECISVTKPQNTWVDLCNHLGYTGRICGNIPIIPYEFPLIHAVDPTATDQTADCGEKALPEAEGQSYRRELNWYRGRRPRTAFTHIQIETLENVFKVNSYPGIEVREELAQKLDLDEDRIQIWFQNRRAKLKRSHRESHFFMVKNTFTNNMIY